jgi:multiple sugar transport system substrate-binding protein
MSRHRIQIMGAILAVLLVAAVLCQGRAIRGHALQNRSEVVFWHFWGGKDRAVVESIVERFNVSQDSFFVRPVAMPGNNLDLKFFLSVAGGSPPDVVNQDDPIVADWAHRDALLPLDNLADPEEITRLSAWLFPAAREIGSYEGRLYALCNGLDIRALYYNADLLAKHGLKPPRMLDELDEVATTIAPPDSPPPRERYGFLPDPRRIWSWGIVFGGRFYDFEAEAVTADSEPIVAALDWMASYSRRYGPDQVARFRKGDQALPGASFPLFEGRYAMIMDGQWRVAEVDAVTSAARRRGEPEQRYGVTPLPTPSGGLERAGWVNGNFFVVPRGAKNPQGAWAFMKFWSGWGGHEADAAQACAAGGWIPPAQAVVDHPTFQQHLKRYPLFRVFVDLASSPDQVPTPAVPAAQFFQDEIIRAAEDAMYKLVPPREALTQAARRIQARLEAERAAK